MNTDEVNALKRDCYSMNDKYMEQNVQINAMSDRIYALALENSELKMSKGDAGTVIQLELENRHLNASMKNQRTDMKLVQQKCGRLEAEANTQYLLGYNTAQKHGEVKYDAEVSRLVSIIEGNEKSVRNRLEDAVRVTENKMKAMALSDTEVQVRIDDAVLQVKRRMASSAHDNYVYAEDKYARLMDKHVEMKASRDKFRDSLRRLEGEHAQMSKNYSDLATDSLLNKSIIANLREALK